MANPFVLAAHGRHHVYQTVSFLDGSCQGNGSELAFRRLTFSAKRKLQLVEEEAHASYHNLGIGSQVLLLRLGEQQFHLEFLE